MSLIPQLLFGGLLEKGGSSTTTLAPEAIMNQRSDRRFSHWNLDPRDAESNLSQETQQDEHPGAGWIPFEGLRHMASLGTTSPFINLRVDQIARHGVRREGRFEIGAEIQMMDPDAKPTRRDKRAMEEIWAVLNMGMPFRDKLEMLARDSVELDAGCAEILYDGKRPYNWMPVDAATIRFARPKDKEVAAGRYRPNQRKLCQWMEDQVKKVWEPHQMMYGIRHPRTNIYVQGYGYPELVQAVDVIGDLIFAKNYNSNYFRNGVHVSTILMLKAKMKPDMFRAWQRMFHAQLKGVENAHRMASILLNPGDNGLNPAEELGKLDLTQSNRDMEFSKYFSFLYRVLAAIMGIDLAELGLGDPADTGRAALTEKRSSDEILMSRERGLKPMLTAIEGWINRWVVWPYDKRYRLRFVGMDGPNPDEWIARHKAKMEVVPPNRVLREMDEEPLPFKWADMVPLNNLAVQLSQMELQGALEPPEEEEPQKGDIDWSQPGNWVAQGPSNPGAAPSQLPAQG